MYKQQGITSIVLLLIVLLATFSIFGIFLYEKQQNGVPSTISNRITTLNNSISPSQPPSVLPTGLSNKPIEPSSKSPSSIDLWTIDSGTNVEFLVTSPSGQQEGYLQASNNYINTIPDAGYGVEKGIGDPDGEGAPLPDHRSFSVWNPKNGIYVLEIISKQPGKYNLSMTFSWGTGSDVKSKEVSIVGTLTKNQVDKYTITIPDGTIQKVSH